ncbi:MAG: DUF2283 domain-containing protein [Deltaproteobacteria bacterium]|nr:DUF2283 domain-containing protein [Deltaproteobacteria bacterium]
MRIIYDSETDTVSIVFREAPVKESDELREGLIVDYGEDGGVVSIELLDAAESIAEPEGIHYEIRGKKAAVL